MKKLKHLGLILFSALVLCLLLAPTDANAATVASGTCGADGDNLIWTLDDEGTLTISGTGAMKDWSYGSAPWYSRRSAVKKVVIGNSVTTIGYWAFSYCTGLTSVTIPDRVTSIGNYAFYYCTDLTSVTIGDSVTSIGDYAFRYCPNLTSVTIGDSVTSIGDYAFSDCYGLTSVTIGDSVTTIGNYAFRSCIGLTSVTIGNSVTTIGDWAFVGCTKLATVHYTGTAAQWQKISVGSNNGPLTNAQKHYDVIKEVTCLSISLYCPTCQKNILVQTIDNHTEVTDAAVSATCTTTGLTEGKHCSVCDEVFVAQEVIPVLAHSYENGSCTVCGAEQPDEKFDIDVARMLLGNALEFQFGIDAAKIPDKTGYYAIVEKIGADGVTTTKEIPASQWGTAGQYHAVIYDGLRATEMADNFYVTIYNAEGQAVSGAKQDAVRDYVARAFATTTATGKTMMVDMLNYGAAAQLQFNYGTTDLANSKLTDAQKACGTAETPEMSNDLVKGTNYQASRFLLESRIQVQLAFKGLTSDMYAIYTYTDFEGLPQEVRIEGADFVIISGKPAGVELSALVYADARSLVNVTVYNADGTVYGTAADSIESCAMRSSGDVFVALMKFADSAKAHLTA